MKKKQDGRQHNEQKGRAQQLLFDLDPRTIELVSGLGFKKSSDPLPFHNLSTLPASPEI